MACFSPIHGFQLKHPNPSGKYGFTVNPAQGRASKPMTIPCGYCIGCRLEKSRQWAVRCTHEAALHDRNCFITLTFNDDALLKRNSHSLRKRDFQLFIKKLRKKFGKNIRYFHCGEYGEKNRRPHYHACLFGFDFMDKLPWKKNLYRSKSLEALWPHGYSSIGQLTFESAAYVARYVVKKRFGKGSQKHYEKVNPSSGEVEDLLPEYVTMSRRPGIGRKWYEKYKKDIYPKDYFHVRGRRSRPTRYYDKLYEVDAPASFIHLKSIRRRKQVQLALDKNQPSLESQETYTKAKLNLKKRSL